MRQQIKFISSLLGAVAIAMTAAAAEVDGARSSFENPWFGETYLALATDEITSVKVRYMSDPYRVVFEFENLNFSDLPVEFGRKVKGVTRINFGPVASGARMVVAFDTPQKVSALDFSATAVDKKAGLYVEFSPIDEMEFLELEERLPAQSDFASIETGRLGEFDGALPLIVIDPGHGGVDPGATRRGVQEKHVTLQAANILRDVLEKSGRYEVILTRERDEFYSLLARRQFAQRVGGDVFLSIHADAVEVGNARGTTIYSLSEEATSQIASHFAHFENRVDLFAGEDIPKEEQDLSLVLTDLARAASKSQAEVLANILQGEWVTLNKDSRESRHESADFAVLKTPEIPSLLLEIGYISSEDDIYKITDERWLHEMANATLSALDKFYE